MPPIIGGFLWLIRKGVKLVTHDADDGVWSFLCNEDDHDIDNYKVVSLQNVVDIDHSINEIYDLPLGHGAFRKRKGKKWQIFKQE